MATAGLGSHATSGGLVPFIYVPFLCVCVCAALYSRASSSPRPEARASWRSRRSCTDSTSQGGPRPSVGGPGRPVTGCGSAGTAGSQPRTPPPPVEPSVSGLVLSLRDGFRGLSAPCVWRGCRQGKPTMTNSEKRRGGKHSL